MTYEQLIDLQNGAQLLFAVLLFGGLLHLVLGLAKPAWVRAGGRGSVVLRTLAAWVLGLGVFAGTIGYTHSQPNGPHSASRYIDEYFAEECAKGADLPACKNQGEPK